MPWIDCKVTRPRRVIKRSLSARPTRGFHTACRDIGASRALVVHAGEDRFPVSSTTEGIGLRALAEELRG